MYPPQNISKPNDHILGWLWPSFTNGPLAIPNIHYSTLYDAGGGAESAHHLFFFGFCQKILVGFYYFLLL